MVIVRSVLEVVVGVSVRGASFKMVWLGGDVWFEAVVLLLGLSSVMGVVSVLLAEGGMGMVTIGCWGGGVKVCLLEMDFGGWTR